MKLTKIEKFMDSNGNTLEFFPLSLSEKAPGFSHRVIFNGENTRRFLPSHVKPNKKSAIYFLELLKNQEIWKGAFK